MKNILLFDLDGTLLNDNKHISEKTISTLSRCKDIGCLIGIVTSRSEMNSRTLIDVLEPDIIISSGGAVTMYNGEVCVESFSKEETRYIINTMKQIISEDCEITIDTSNAHYRNYKNKDEILGDPTWGSSLYCDFHNFDKSALKICVETANDDKISLLIETLDFCDHERFINTNWHKFTRRNVTKESAIIKLFNSNGWDLNDAISFGDDIADMEMIRVCGVGVAMGNSANELKKVADIVIGNNNEDSIADFLIEHFDL